MKRYKQTPLGRPQGIAPTMDAHLRQSRVYGSPVYFLFFAFILLVYLFPLSFPAHADGGAPNRAYVAGAAKGIGIIDISQPQAVPSTLSVEGDPYTIQLSLNGHFLYVTQPTLGRVSVLSARTGDPICSADVLGNPALLGLDTGNNLLYAAGNKGANVTSLDANTCAVKHIFKTDGPVYGLAIANVGSSTPGSNGDQLWVAAGTSLTIFDDISGQQLGSIPIKGQPQYITIPPGATVYVSTRQGDLDAVDLNTRQVLTLLSGGLFGPMDYDAMTGQVYVPDQKNNQLDVLAPISSGTTTLPHEPARTIALGVTPESIAITSDGQLGFAALSTGYVAMLDIPGRQLLMTILVGGSPHFIITGLNPPLLGDTPQQVAIWGTVINVAAYVFVIALLIVPIVLFRRFTRSPAVKPKGK